MPNLNADLAAISTHLLRQAQVSRMPADTYIKLPDLSVGWVLGFLGYLTDDNDEYATEDREYAAGLLDQLQGFVSQAHVYQYPRPSLTVDAVIFGLDMSQERPKLTVLLIKRGRPGTVYEGCWAIPGGFVDPDEDLEEAARRELREETQCEVTFIEQLATFGKPGRDPRGHVVSVAYMALVRSDGLHVQADDDAAAGSETWWPVDMLPTLNLAFDHAEILDTAVRRLRSKLRWQPIGIDLLPPTFTLDELQAVYEVVLGRPLDKRNFRKRVLGYDVLVSANSRRISSKPGPNPELWRFDRAAYEALIEDGEAFEV